MIKNNKINRLKEDQSEMKTAIKNLTQILI